MHICIVGTGASGWLTAHSLSRLPQVEKITIVGSDKIPSIGVGESTTFNFMEYLFDVFGFNLNKPCKHFMKFLVDIDAAIKFGVYYDGWSKKPFLHQFVTITHDMLKQQKLLGKKPEDGWVNEYISPNIHYVMKNHIYMARNTIPAAVHFDANMFIRTMQTLAKENEKINHVVGTAVDLLYEGEEAKTLILDDGRKIDANYFVSCIGQTAFNQKVFKEEYKSYSDVLLTNRAIAGPIEYTDKRNQFVPYTTSRSMKYGWRWITPTWSRIGTGYVFSNNHVSDDEAIHEFLTNVGDRTFKIDPFVVDFTPRKAINSFKKNTCTIGMAAGFVEPLDAPGLSLTTNAIVQLKKIITGHSTIEKSNEFMDWSYKLWICFILHQYKVSSRNDTKFWEDAKNVNFPLYDEIVAWTMGKTTKMPDGVLGGHDHKTIWEPTMFWNTTAGRDITWEVADDTPLVKPKTMGIDLGHHFDYIKGIHELYSGV